ncbi:hypothetical protein Btru_034997 [Bulinus truncatus]|nr:hypothetical protein Btru_034997 [Bulinus truncatus]
MQNISAASDSRRTDVSSEEDAGSTTGDEEEEERYLHEDSETSEVDQTCELREEEASTEKTECKPTEKRVSFLTTEDDTETSHRPKLANLKNQDSEIFYTVDNSTFDEVYFDAKDAPASEALVQILYKKEKEVESSDQVTELIFPNQESKAETKEYDETEITNDELPIKSEQSITTQKEIDQNDRMDMTKVDNKLTTSVTTYQPISDADSELESQTEFLCEFQDRQEDTCEVKNSTELCVDDIRQEIRTNVSALEIDKGIDSSEIDKDIHSSEIDKDIDDSSEIQKDIHSSEINKDIDDASEIHKDIHSSEIDKDIDDSSEIDKDIHSSEINKDIDDASEIDKDIHSSEIDKDIDDSSEIQKDFDDSLEIDKDIHLSEIDKDIGDSSEIDKDIDDSSEIDKNIDDSSEIHKDIDNIKSSDDVMIIQHTTKTDAAADTGEFSQDLTDNIDDESLITDYTTDFQDEKRLDQDVVTDDNDMTEICDESENDFAMTNESGFHESMTEDTEDNLSVNTEFREETDHVVTHKDKANVLTEELCGLSDIQHSEDNAQTEEVSYNSESWNELLRSQQEEVAAVSVNGAEICIKSEGTRETSLEEQAVTGTNVHHENSKAEDEDYSAQLAEVQSLMTSFSRNVSSDIDLCHLDVIGTLDTLVDKMAHELQQGTLSTTEVMQELSNLSTSHRKSSSLVVDSTAHQTNIESPTKTEAGRTPSTSDAADIEGTRENREQLEKEIYEILDEIMSLLGGAVTPEQQKSSDSDSTSIDQAHSVEQGETPEVSEESENRAREDGSKDDVSVDHQQETSLTRTDQDNVNEDETVVPCNTPMHESMTESELTHEHVEEDDLFILEEHDLMATQNETESDAVSDVFTDTEDVSTGESSSLNTECPIEVVSSEVGLCEIDRTEQFLILETHDKERTLTQIDRLETFLANEILQVDNFHQIDRVETFIVYETNSLTKSESYEMTSTSRQAIHHDSHMKSFLEVEEIQEMRDEEENPCGYSIAEIQSESYEDDYIQCGDQTGACHDVEHVLKQTDNDIEILHDDNTNLHGVSSVTEDSADGVSSGSDEFEIIDANDLFDVRPFWNISEQLSTNCPDSEGQPQTSNNDLLSEARAVGDPEQSVLFRLQTLYYVDRLGNRMFADDSTCQRVSSPASIESDPNEEDFVMIEDDGSHDETSDIQSSNRDSPDRSETLTADNTQRDFDDRLADEVAENIVNEVLDSQEYTGLHFSQLQSGQQEDSFKSERCNGAFIDVDIVGKCTETSNDDVDSDQNKTEIDDIYTDQNETVIDDVDTDQNETVIDDIYTDHNKTVIEEPTEEMTQKQDFFVLEKFETDADNQIEQENIQSLTSLDESIIHEVVGEDDRQSYKAVLQMTETKDVAKQTYDWIETPHVDQDTNETESVDREATKTQTDSKETTAFDQDATETSSVEEEITQTPSVDEEITETLSVDQYATQTPSVDEEITETLSVDQYAKQTPSVDEEITETTTVDQEATQTPSVDEEITQTPSLDEEITETLNVDQNATERPSVGEEITETSSVEHEMTETPHVHEEITETPSVEHEMTETPRVHEEITETPSVDEEITETTTVDQEATQTPSLDEEITETPSVDEEITQTPSLDEEMTETPIVDQDATETPSIDEEITETSDVEEEITQTPSVDREATKTPSVEEEITETLNVDQNATETPSVGEEITETPSVDEEITETTTVDQDATETPSVDEDITETPDVEEEITQTPSVDREATKTPSVEEEIIETTTVDQDATETSSVEQEITETPSVDVEITETTTVDQDASETPSVDEDITETPDVEEEITPTPSVDREATKTPSVEEEIIETTTVDQDATETSSVEQEITETPSVDEEITETTTVDQDATETSSVEQEITETPTVDEEITETLSVDQYATQTPSVDEEITETTTVDQDATETSSVDEEITETTTVDQDATETTSVDEEITETTTVNQDATESTSVDQDATETPSVDEEITPTPSVDEKITETPNVDEKKTETTTVDEEITQTTTVDQDPTETPSVDEEITETLSVDQYATETPSVVVACNITSEAAQVQLTYDDLLGQTLADVPDTSAVHTEDEMSLSDSQSFSTESNEDSISTKINGEGNYSETDIVKDTDVSTGEIPQLLVNDDLGGSQVDEELSGEEDVDKEVDNDDDNYQSGSEDDVDDILDFQSPQYRERLTDEVASAISKEIVLMAEVEVAMEDLTNPKDSPMSPMDESLCYESFARYDKDNVKTQRSEVVESSQAEIKSDVPKSFETKETSGAKMTFANYEEFSSAQEFVETYEEISYNQENDEKYKESLMAQEIAEAYEGSSSVQEHVDTYEESACAQQHVEKYEETSTVPEIDEAYEESPSENDNVETFEESSSEQEHVEAYEESSSAQDPYETYEEPSSAQKHVETYEETSTAQELDEAYEESPSENDNVETFEESSSEQEHVETYEEPSSAHEHVETEEETSSAQEVAGTYQESASSYEQVETYEETSDALENIETCLETFSALGNLPRYKDTSHLTKDDSSDEENKNPAGPTEPLPTGNQNVQNLLENLETNGDFHDTNKTNEIFEEAEIDSGEDMNEEFLGTAEEEQELSQNTVITSKRRIPSLYERSMSGHLSRAMSDDPGKWKTSFDPEEDLIIDDVIEQFKSEEIDDIHQSFPAEYQELVIASEKYTSHITQDDVSETNHNMNIAFNKDNDGNKVLEELPQMETGSLATNVDDSFKTNRSQNIIIKINDEEENVVPEEMPQMESDVGRFDDLVLKSQSIMIKDDDNEITEPEDGEKQQTMSRISKSKRRRLQRKRRKLAAEGGDSDQTCDQSCDQMSDAQDVRSEFEESKDTPDQNQVPDKRKKKTRKLVRHQMSCSTDSDAGAHDPDYEIVTDVRENYGREVASGETQHAYADSESEMQLAKKDAGKVSVRSDHAPQTSRPSRSPPIVLLPEDVADTEPNRGVTRRKDKNAGGHVKAGRENDQPLTLDQVLDQALDQSEHRKSSADQEQLLLPGAHKIRSRSKSPAPPSLRRLTGQPRRRPRKNIVGEIISTMNNRRLPMSQNISHVKIINFPSLMMLLFIFNQNTMKLNTNL